MNTKCVDMCVDMCVGMCAGVCVDMCVDMPIGPTDCSTFLPTEAREYEVTLPITMPGVSSAGSRRAPHRHCRQHV